MRLPLMIALLMLAVSGGAFADGLIPDLGFNWQFWTMALIQLLAPVLKVVVSAVLMLFVIKFALKLALQLLDVPFVQDLAKLAITKKFF